MAYHIGVFLARLVGLLAFLRAQAQPDSAKRFRQLRPEVLGPELLCACRLRPQDQRSLL